MDSPGDRLVLHATSIAVGERAALIMGASGSGKSDLALRCIMQGALLLGEQVAAELIADDQTIVTLERGRLICTAPPAIAGLIEVRGLGIVSLPRRHSAQIALTVELKSGAIERLPDSLSREILGVSVPLLALSPFEASAPLKLLLALTQGIPDNTQGALPKG